jgi:Zn-dependent protease with chaperone function/Zn-finger nucleic acid-binding protein
MRCPDCHSALDLVTAGGVQLDLCPICGGVWLDEGELFHFTAAPLDLAQRLRSAAENPAPSQRASPRSGRAMATIQLGPDVELDLCPASGGLWITAASLHRLPALGLTLSPRAIPRLDPVAAGWDLPGVTGATAGPDGATDPIGTGADEPDPTGPGGHSGGGTRDHGPPRGRGLAATGVLSSPGMPALALRGVATLGLLWLLVGALLVATVDLLGLPLELGAGLAIVIVGGQFLLAPTIMDWLLPRISPLRWVTPDALPDGVGTFMVQLARSQNMRTPRLGIIEDGGPNAFAYGRTPNDARVVVSRGAIELLDPAELETVIAHEVAHAKHWDMLVMTLANMVPVLAYYLYRAALQGGGHRKGAHQVALGAYILYIASRYVVLWISRAREYYADRFAGEVTGRPDHLASALVRIAYGLAGQAAEPAGDGKGDDRRGMAEAVGALGIFDPEAARSMAIASLAASPGGGRGGGGTGLLDPDGVKGAMAWDLWNPWGRFFELHSTHPLVARRLERLGEHAVRLGREPFVNFDLERRESYWDEFLVDLLILALPFMVAAGAVAAFLTWPWPAVLGFGLVGVGLAARVKLAHRYPDRLFPRMRIASLLRKVKVSGVRGVPCTLSGRLIGRGGHAVIWSEDFVLQDNTGVIFLDHRQPLRIWEFFFGLLRRKEYDDADAVVTGWYRRAPVPYVEINTLQTGTQTLRAWVYPLQLFACWIAVIVGAAIAVLL